MYIESLSIKQFRCFEHAEMAFQFPGRIQDRDLRLPNVNLLLGDNGTGKTAVLKALSLAVLSPIIASTGFLPYYLVRRSNTDDQANALGRCAKIDASWSLDLQDTYPALAKLGNSHSENVLTETNIESNFTTEVVISINADGKIWRGLYDENAPAFFLVGYGATRRAENTESFDSSARNRVRALRYQRVASLFEDYVSLIPVDVWRVELEEQQRLAEGIDLLNTVLPKDVQLPLENAQRKAVLFSVRGILLPFGALSDGYRAFIGWVGDLLYHMCRVTPPNHKMTDLRGVVMVDELDLLLHPAWQRTVVESLATTFPNLQFFFTSHSPIITGTLEAANIYVTETDPETGATTIVPGQERVHGLSADQILTSSYFDLPTPRAPDAVNQMNDLARDAWAGDEQASLEFLRRMTEGFEPVTSAASLQSANGDTGAAQE